MGGVYQKTTPFMVATDIYRLQSLLAASIVATTVRLFMYIFGGHKSHLRGAIETMGITVVVLEICIVMLRFFSAITVMRYALPRVRIGGFVGSVVFVLLGTLTTYVLTTIPLLLPVRYESKNVALTYLSSRPFEFVPVVVEYVALYMMNRNIVGAHSFAYVICLSTISLIVAIHDTDYKSTRSSRDHPPAV